MSDIKTPKNIELGDSSNDNSYATLTITAKKDNDQSYFMWEPTLTFYKLDASGTATSPDSELLSVLGNLGSEGFVGLIIQNENNITKSQNDYTYSSSEKQSSVSLQFNASGVDSLVDKVIWLKFSCKKRNGTNLTDKWCKVTFVDQEGGLTNVQFDWT